MFQGLFFFNWYANGIFAAMYVKSSIITSFMQETDKQSGTKNT